MIGSLSASACKSLARRLPLLAMLVTDPITDLAIMLVTVVVLRLRLLLARKFPTSCLTDL